jgi:hypothetical protein
MKHIPGWVPLGCLLLIPWGIAAGEFDPSHTAFARVLTKHVSAGGVNYAGLKADSGGLQTYLDEIAGVKESEFQSWPKQQQLALLINLYNAATLQLIVDHYPVDSIRSIGGLFSSPWKLAVVRLWGATNSLDWLEHTVIRPRYREPRVHFALVCAAKGCPPLRAEPYVAGRLDDQLDDQARTFLGQHAKNRYDPASRTLYLSPIFKWYRDDFTAGGKSLTEFVQPYLKVMLPAESNLRIQFTDYDWSLNEARKKTH